jgi:hypothetical protein
MRRGVDLVCGFTIASYLACPKPPSYEGAIVKRAGRKE